MALVSHASATAVGGPGIFGSGVVSASAKDPSSSTVAAAAAVAKAAAAAAAANNNVAHLAHHHSANGRNGSVAAAAAAAIRQNPMANHLNVSGIMNHDLYIACSQTTKNL